MWFRGSLNVGPVWGLVAEYRVPSDARVVEAIEEALARHPIVDSQQELGALVRGVLQGEEKAFRVSDARVRRLAVQEGLAEVTVETGTTSQPPREACPVCGGEVEAVRNRTLTGGETVVGVRCARCSYRAGARHEVPLRYRFLREDQG